GVIDHRTIRCRILQQRTEHLRSDPEIGIARHPDLDPAHARARLHDVYRLRMTLRCDEENFLALLSLERVAHRHRFGSSCCFIEQGCVGDLEPGEVHHHRLEIEQRLETSLRNLRLIRRIGRVPAGVLEDVSLDHRRCHAVRVAHSDERAEDLIFGRQCTEVGENLELGQSLWQIETFAPANFAWNGGVYQLIERRKAESLHHLGNIFLVRSYMSWNEGFCGGNRCFNVLDCGAHRSDNLTPYAPPAKLQSLASSHRRAPQRRREHGPRQRASGARGTHWRNGFQHLLLEPSDAFLRTQSTSIGLLRSPKDSGSRYRCGETTHRWACDPASPGSHLQRHCTGTCRFAARDLLTDQPHPANGVESTGCSGRDRYEVRAAYAERAQLL